MVKGETRNPVHVLLLCLIPFYFIYWLYTVSKEINAAKGKEVLNPALAIVAGLCAPVDIFYAYLMDKELQEFLPERGVAYESKAALWIIGMFLCFGTFLMAFQVQTALNEVWAKDSASA